MRNDGSDKETRRRQDIVWFDRPASHFAESTPLGNGRLGAMVFGGTAQERIVLNESSVWSGSREDSNREDAHLALPEIRRLLLAGKNREAQDLFMGHFTCKGKGSGYAVGADIPFGSYQVLGTLHLSFFQHTSSGPGIEAVARYRRALDLSSALASTSFTHHGVLHTRECFVSAPADAIVIRMRADRPGMTSFDARLDRPECFVTSADRENGLLMVGQLENGVDGKGVRYACRMRVLTKGGRLRIKGSALAVQGADEALVLVTAATNLKSFAGRGCDDEVAASLLDMEKVGGQSWDQLLSEHRDDYRRYYDRVELMLGPGDAGGNDAPTPSRLQSLREGRSDPRLDALYFNFGRYLFISCSRRGGMPANLQGIWAEEILTPWNGDWHFNAQQMIYWPAEVCNLPELHEPYLKLIESLQHPGAKTAKAYYKARGWVVHTFTNPWGFTAPGEDASWGSTAASAAWLCQHLWDHYLFSPHEGFLKWAYPIMKGAALFYLDMLMEEPTHQWLVTAPADSPENSFLSPDGEVCELCMGPTYDLQLLRFLFGACVTASEILGTDGELRSELVLTLKRLAPTRVSLDGRIMEWLEEYREPLPNHRHISHLWGLFPGDEIDLERTPALATAAARTLRMRGDSSTGWAMCHRLCTWARLGEGGRAYELYQRLLKVSTFPNMFDRSYHAPETEQNPVMPALDDFHHAFQIDGNFGAVAGVVEMLLQSRVDIRAGSGSAEFASTVRVLPALPPAWAEGRLSGVRARGGFEVDVEWKRGRLSSLEIRSTGGTRCRVVYRNKSVELSMTPLQSRALDGNLAPRDR